MPNDETVGSVSYLCRRRPGRSSESAVVRRAAGDLGLRVVDLRATLLDPVDLRGLPRVTRDAAVWCPPAFLPRTGMGVLFLDELGPGPAPGPGRLPATRARSQTRRVRTAGRLGRGRGVEPPGGPGRGPPPDLAPAEPVRAPRSRRLPGRLAGVGGRGQRRGRGPGVRPVPAGVVIPVRPGGQPAGVPDATVLAVRFRGAGDGRSGVVARGRGRVRRGRAGGRVRRLPPAVPRTARSGRRPPRPGPRPGPAGAGRPVRPRRRARRTLSGRPGTADRVRPLRQPPARRVRPAGHARRPGREPNARRPAGRTGVDRPGPAPGLFPAT